MKHVRSAWLLACAGVVWGCSSDEGAPSGSSGGSAGAGGSAAAGASGSAGTAGGAGGSSGATAGTSGSGGSSSGRGGASGSGATSGGDAGASAGSAGAGSGAGGMSAGSGGGGSGGAGMAGNSGSSGSAGTSGGAGAAGSSGASGSGGEVVPQPGMNFFVTSKGWAGGGKIGSLDAADAFCTELATAVSAELGEKTWHAYLSTSTVDARDRIGTGPWRNQAGVVIANNLTDLHAQEAGEALDETWPPADTSIALDETGTPLDNSIHDILTGSKVDGTVEPTATCSDWTSDSPDDVAQVGHSNRNGGGRPPYFNATHTVGCAPATSMNYESGTVTSGGGRGSLYCFALEPSSGP